MRHLFWHPLFGRILASPPVAVTGYAILGTLTPTGEIVGRITTNPMLGELTPTGEIVGRLSR